MAFDLRNFGDESLQADYLAFVLDHRRGRLDGLARLWDYFRNDLSPGAPGNPRPYAQAQEIGLPPRITGVPAPGQSHTDYRRKEVVVENDIAWRVHTMVDFLFGRPPVVRSRAADGALAAEIGRVLDAMFEANGGVSLLQEAALLGSVYGLVDIALRTPADGMADLPRRPTPLPPPADASAGRRPGAPQTREDLAPALAAASSLQLETIEAPRLAPILDENDYRRVRYWVQRFHKHPPRLAAQRRAWWSLGLGGRDADQASVEVVEIIGPTWWQRYEDRQLADEGPNWLGRIPVVHVQNLPLVGGYEGLSDVEPLIPLQDELNIRLSDRASRVTYQSFKMFPLIFSPQKKHPDRLARAFDSS